MIADTLSARSFGPSVQQSPRTINKFFGSILALFGQALKVETTNGKTSYVTINELKNYVFDRFQKFNSAETKSIRSDKIIHDLFLSTVNPIKGSIVTKETVEKFRRKFVKLTIGESFAGPKELYATLRKIRATIHTKQGMTEDRKKFIGDIRLGDIIFHRTDDTVDSQIVNVQTLFKSMGFAAKQRHRDSCHHNHVFICAKIDDFGKKWFAEAAWPSGKKDEIRLISEDDARCFLKQDHGAVSEIFRCSDQNLAERAADEARAITTKLDPQAKDSSEPQPTELRYSIASGMRALVSSMHFGHNAKARLFQWIRSTSNGKMPTNFIKPNSFFCSYLVAYAYQMAEARPIVDKRVKNSNGCALNNLIKAHYHARVHGRELDRKMQMTLDPRHTTVADFYSWINENNRLFISVGSYQQPTKPE